MTVEELLVEREKQYGDYTEVAEFYAALNTIAEAQKRLRWCAATPECNLALDMIFVKLARLLCGGMNHTDTWNDIAGYATLAARRCTK